MKNNKQSQKIRCYKSDFEEVEEDFQRARQKATLALEKLKEEITTTIGKTKNKSEKALNDAKKLNEEINDLRKTCAREIGAIMEIEEDSTPHSNNLLFVNDE